MKPLAVVGPGKGVYGSIWRDHTREVSLNNIAWMKNEAGRVKAVVKSGIAPLSADSG